MKISISAAWTAAIGEFARCALAVGVPATTVRTRCDHLGRTARRIGIPDPWQVTGDALLEYWRRQEWATETRRGHRSTLRVFYAWAVERGCVGVSPAESLPIIRPARPRPRPASESAYQLALACADERTRVMIRLAAEAGLRRGEVAQVHSRDLEEDLTGWSLVVHGKGSRDRLVPLNDTLAAALRRLPAGWAFPGDCEGHLSPRWVGTLVARALPDGYSMHSLRHRFATRAYDIERDVFVVQDLLGHASPATTRTYVQVPNNRLRATVRAVAELRPAG